MRVLLILALLLGGASLAALDVRRTLSMDVGSTGDQTLEIRRGQTWDQLVHELASRMALAPRQQWYLRAYGRLTGHAYRIRAGEYRPRAGDSLRGLLQRIVEGDVVLHALTLVEGWRFDQALAAIQAHPKIRRVLPGDNPAAVMKALGHPGLHPEGRFLPETYRFALGETDLDFLRRAQSAMNDRLAEAWAARRDGLPLKTPEDLLILASIVERETGLPSERGQVAGVFIRRLQRGMRLQTDPTVIYGMGAAFDGNIRRRDLRRDTPYNTYTRSGLPPTPICLPGEESLRAAAQPEDGDALYFVSRGDGSHQFSATLEEHNRAVRRFQLGKGS